MFSEYLISVPGIAPYPSQATAIYRILDKNYSELLRGTGIREHIVSVVTRSGAVSVKKLFSEALCQNLRGELQLSRTSYLSLSQ